MHGKTKKVIILLLMTICVSKAVFSATGAKGVPDYHYSGSLEIDPRSGFIRADWEIRVFDENETSITFFLRDTLEDLEVSGPGVGAVTLEKQSGFGDFWAIAASLAQATAEAPGEPRSIRVSYAGVLLPEPMENRINAEYKTNKSYFSRKQRL